MDYAKLETACLAHVDDTYYYGAYCRACKQSARPSLVKLRIHVGDDLPLRKVRERLRCERCADWRADCHFVPRTLFDQMPGGTADPINANQPSRFVSGRTVTLH